MEKFVARFIIEILGRPPEHIKFSLSQLLDKLAREKGVKTNERKISEPLAVPDSKDLFTSFADVTIECDSLEVFLGIIFAYMPANVELISPEQLIFTNTDINLLANKLVLRLHDYDSVAKRMLKERDFLVEKLKEYAPHLFKKPEETQSIPKKEVKGKKEKKKKGKKN